MCTRLNRQESLSKLCQHICFKAPCFVDIFAFKLLANVPQDTRLHWPAIRNGERIYPSHALGLVMSALMAMQRTPFLLSSLQTSWAFLSWTSTTATAAPASPRACAKARPMPWPAPESQGEHISGEMQHTVGLSAAPSDVSNPADQCHWTITFIDITGMEITPRNVLLVSDSWLMFAIERTQCGTCDESHLWIELHALCYPVAQKSSLYFISLTL